MPPQLMVESKRATAAAQPLYPWPGRTARIEDRLEDAQDPGKGARAVAMEARAKDPR